MWRFAECIVQSGWAPKGFNQQAVVVAIQLGLELGLSPMSALQNVAVINGRPAIYGDAALALVRASGLLQWIIEKFEGSGDTRKAICTTKRTTDPEPMVSEFSVQDAKTAGLWGKAGPWSQYPDRMLRFRARGFNLRDNFGDVLKGFRTAEEQDAPDESQAIPQPPPIGRVRMAKPAKSTPAPAQAQCAVEAPTPSQNETVEVVVDEAKVVEAEPAGLDLSEPGEPDNGLSVVSQLISNINTSMERAKTPRELLATSVMIDKNREALGEHAKTLRARMQEKLHEYDRAAQESYKR